MTQFAGTPAFHTESLDLAAALRALAAIAAVLTAVALLVAAAA